MQVEVERTTVRSSWKVSCAKTGKGALCK